MNESSAKEWVEDSAKKTDSAPDFVFDIVDLMLEEVRCVCHSSLLADCCRFRLHKF